MGWKDLQLNTLSPSESEKPEERKKFWERAATVTPWLLTLLSLAFAIWRFGSEQQQANRRPFLEKQLSLTFEVADTAAILATTKDEKAWKVAHGRFMALKYGELRIVEDRALSLTVAKFWNDLPDEDHPKLPMKHLQLPALEVAEVCRDLIARSWRVDLQPIPTPTEKAVPFTSAEVD